MKCRDMREKWNGYVNGECSEDEEREIEEHIQSCAECEQFVDENLGEQKSISQDALYPVLTHEQQHQIVRKAVWKNRLMTALTALGIFFCISLASMMITALYYAFVGHTANKVIQTSTQMTVPNVYSEGGVTSTNVFFNADLQEDLRKQVGSESKYVGKYEGKMVFNHLNVTNSWLDLRYVVDLDFLHPGVYGSRSKEEQQSLQWGLNETWNALDMLPEGTVSEVAISFDDFYTIDEVYQMLNDYSIDIVWYAIDTGMEGKRDSVFTGTRVWGIHEYAFESLLEEEKSSLIPERASGHLREKAFKNGLQFLAEHKKLAKRVVWYLEEHGTLEEMIDYVDKNGVKSYGVVVTGPTKELLKLKDNKHVQYATLGVVDFWNWYGKPKVEY